MSKDTHIPAKFLTNTNDKDKLKDFSLLNLAKNE